MAAKEETVFSFQEIVGGHNCVFKPRIGASPSKSLIPLLQCNRSMDGHKSALALVLYQERIKGTEKASPIHTLFHR